MPLDGDILLERALKAETELESARERIASLESRLRAVFGSDPTTATRALSWMGRARNAEALLRELSAWIEQHPSLAEVMPVAFVQRSTAQLRAVEIMRRDAEAFGERLDDASDDEVWQTWANEQGVHVSRFP